MQRCMERNKNVFCLIMAGGSGTRFWPLSRKKLPKQFLNLSGEKILIKETIDRFLPFVEPNKIFIITNVDYYEYTKTVVGNVIPEENFFCEPEMKNTTACICYATEKIKKKYGDGLMIVTPSDSFIKYNDVFEDAIKTGLLFADKNNSLITIGIKPTFPATGYGYILSSSNVVNSVHKVLRFVEKPNKEKALEYIENSNYFWNSGLFIWKASTIVTPA